MDINVLIEQLTMLFIIVLAGYICGRTHLMNQQVSKGLSNLIVGLTCPCLVLASTMGDRMPDRALILPLLLVGVATYAILLPLSTWMPRLWGCQDPERGLHSFMLTFANVGFIGYPVVASVFGPEAVFYASVLNVANTVSVFVWGAEFIKGKEVGSERAKEFKSENVMEVCSSEAATGKKRLANTSFPFPFFTSLLKHVPDKFYSPAMIGTYLSIIVVAFAWHAPRIIAQPLTLVGNVTVPASLLIIGYSISQIPARHMAGSYRVWITSLCRLLVMPLVVCFCFKAIVWLLPVASCVFDPYIVQINTLIIAMPVASFGTIFCLKYGVDETVMAQGTFLTTMLSLVTIPIVAGLI